MKVITATMAKNISNDFMNNECGPYIKKTMDEILLKAEQGGHFVQMLIPATWDNITKHNVAMFFTGLGYDITVHPTAIGIVW